MQPEAKRDFPLPCFINVEALVRVPSGARVWKQRRGMGLRMCKWLRMKFAAGLPNNGDWQWHPATRESCEKHRVFACATRSSGTPPCWQRFYGASRNFHPQLHSQDLHSDRT